MGHISDGNGRKARLYRWLAGHRPSEAAVLRVVGNNPIMNRPQTLQTWLVQEVNPESTSTAIDLRINDFSEEFEMQVTGEVQWVGPDDAVLSTFNLRAKPVAQVGAPLHELDGSAQSQLKQLQLLFQGTLAAVFKQQETAMASMNDGWQRLFQQYERALEVVSTAHGNRAAADDERIARYEETVAALQARLAEFEANGESGSKEHELVAGLLQALVANAAQNNALAKMGAAS